MVESAEITIPKSATNQSSQFCPTAVRKAIRVREKARHLWEATRDPIHKAAFNKRCKEVKHLLQKISNEKFTAFFLSLDTTKDTSYSLWRVAKATKKLSCYIPPFQSSNNIWARSDL